MSAYSSVMETVEATVEMTVNDARCDRCGARAQAMVILPSGGELLFCGHHINEFADGLDAVNARVNRVELAAT